MSVANQAMEGLLMGISIFILRIVMYVTKSATNVKGSMKNQSSCKLLIDARVLKQAVKNCPQFMGPLVNSLLDDWMGCGNSF